MYLQVSKVSWYFLLILLRSEKNYLNIWYLVVLSDILKKWQYQSYTTINLYLAFNPRPPEAFFVTRGVVATSSGFSITNIHSYESPLSMNTKISTICLRMTSLWRHNVSATSKWTNWKYIQRIGKNRFSAKKISYM